MSSNDIDELFKEHTGGGLPSYKFGAIGSKVKGTVTRRSIVEVPKLDKSGEKQKNLILELLLDEDHTQLVWDKTQTPPRQVERTSKEWSVWVKAPSQQLKSLQEAVKAAGARPGSPDEGDRVSCEYYDTKPPTQIGHNPAKLFRWSFRQGVRPGEDLGDLV